MWVRVWARVSVRAMSKLSEIIKTTVKEAIVVIINRPIVSSLHIRISAIGLLCLPVPRAFFTIIKFYNNEMYLCLPHSLASARIFHNNEM